MLPKPLQLEHLLTIETRTGFFICCYMVERLGYKLQDAVDEFAAKRGPGIKHSFFIDELFVRYGMKMQRRNTIVGLN
jgi:hypothetical protein